MVGRHQAGHACPRLARGRWRAADGWQYAGGDGVAWSLPCTRPQVSYPVSRTPRAACNGRTGHVRRCKFLTEGSTPRRGRRVLPVTLSHHHKPFGSARTARGLRAPDLVGAAPRTVARRAPWGARKRPASIRTRRTIHDSPHQRVRSRQRGLDSIRALRNVSCVAGEGTCPTGTESSSRRFGGGLQNTILAFQPPWYEFEMPWPLRGGTQTRPGPSARTPTDRGAWGFGEGVVSSDHRPRSWPERTPSPAVRKAYLEIYHGHCSKGRELHSRTSKIIILLILAPNQDRA